MRRTRLAGFAVALALITHAAFISAAPGNKFKQGTGNKHNLSTSGPGPYKATDATDPRASQVCIFCHTPHNSVGKLALWNRKDTNQTFGHYSSTSLKLQTDSVAKTASDYKSEPNGASRLCLSCHDGATALGAIENSVKGSNPIEINSGLTTKMTGSHVFDRAKITNSHHPVSFIYNGTVRDRLNALEPGNGYRLPTDPVAVPEVRLDREKRMQCTTCHDPHQTQFDDPLTPFWVKSGANATDAHDKVCLACHNFTAPNL